MRPGAGRSGCDLEIQDLGYSVLVYDREKGASNARTVLDGVGGVGRGDWSVGDARSKCRGLDVRDRRVEAVERKEEE